VIVTNLFGHPARLKEIKQICEENDIYLIEDNAQSIFAKEANSYAGTVGHIGVFSLNVHKQIQVGEGGIAVTNYLDLAIKMRDAMNHGEMRRGILGLNLRMTEVTAAMACEQLQKAKKVLSVIREFAEAVTHLVRQFEIPITPPVVREGCVHSYYCWAGIIQGDVNIVPPFKQGYMQPLYYLKPFYGCEPLPTVERVQGNLILLEICGLHGNLDIEDMVKSLRGAQT
jgi:dTDP-4-amino-4,6-dideoxygalactose transaminase